MSRACFRRYLCLLFSITLLVFSCKGTPETKSDETDLEQSISEPVPTIPEDEQETAVDLAQGDSADQELPGEGEQAVEDNLADEDSPAIADSEEPETEPSELAVVPDEPPSPAQPQLEPAPTVPSTPPEVTAVTEPETTTANTDTEEPASTTEAEGDVPQEPAPSITRWPPPAPPVLEPPVLRPQILPDEEPVFSRVVRVTVGQLLEIPFRGTGWVYMGEMNSLKGIAFGSRRLEPEGQNFVFRVEAPGTYALKFYKEDFIRDIIFNDYVQVIAEANPEATNAPWLSPSSSTNNRVVAEPRWPSTLEEAEIARLGGRRPTSAPLTSGTSSPQASNLDRATSPTSGTATNGATSGARPSNGATPPANTTPVTPPQPASPALPAITDEGVTPVRPPAISGGAENAAEASDTDWPPEVFLQKAQEEFDAGKVAEAIALLNRMRELYPIGNDELYWLLGQFYEANSPSRDILLSLDYYRRLIKEFPQSRRYNDARRRIAYLERYYINIQ